MILQDGFTPLTLAMRGGHECKIRAAIAQGQRAAALRGKRTVKGWGTNDPWGIHWGKGTSDSTTSAYADSRTVKAGRNLLDFTKSRTVTHAYTVKKGGMFSLDSHARTLKFGVTYVQMRLNQTSIH
jgi:hypothetical protein